jgi:DNA-binding phage protein
MLSGLKQFRMRLAILVEMMGGQSELARRSGDKITQTEISRLLKDEREPMFETAIGLAAACEVSLDWLAGRTGRVALRAPIDKALLKESVESAQEGFAELELEELPASTKAEIVADIYETYSGERRKPQRRKVMEIIRAAA